VSFGKVICHKGLLIATVCYERPRSKSSLASEQLLSLNSWEVRVFSLFENYKSETQKLQESQ